MSTVGTVGCIDRRQRFETSEASQVNTWCAIVTYIKEPDQMLYVIVRRNNRYRTYELITVARRLQQERG